MVVSCLDTGMPGVELDHHFQTARQDFCSSSVFISRGRAAVLVIGIFIRRPTRYLRQAHRVGHEQFKH